MFGDMYAPKMKQRSRPSPVPADILNPCPNPPHCWAHMGRPADTDHHVKLMQYKQRKDADYNKTIEGIKQRMAQDTFSTKFDKHTEKRRFQCEIKKRFEIRLQEYEDSIDKRREKLKDLLSKEERDFYRETVDNAQRGGETRMETMKQRSEMLIAKREAERLEVVKQKRLQQYMQRCGDLRGALAKKNLIETKNGQLQQIRENEARREVEREMEQMWHDLTMKEVAAKIEREEYDTLDRYTRDKGNQNTWELQVQAKELLKAEADRIAEEDRAEMDKLRETMRREQIEALYAKERKREETDREIREQIRIQEEFLAHRKKEEDALDQSFTLLAQIELDRERAKHQDSTTAAKREMVQYRTSLVMLEQQRKEEDRQLNELLEEHKAQIQKQQDEAKCKVEAAKKKLHKDVLEGRAEQIRYKQEIAQEQLKMKQAEDELLRLAHETNERLAAEFERQETIARQQYREDLNKQIEYNEVVQERERQELEKQLAIGKQEEERYQQMVSDMCVGKIRAGDKHPFRKVLERYNCDCEEPSVKPPY